MATKFRLDLPNREGVNLIVEVDSPEESEMIVYQMVIDQCRKMIELADKAIENVLMQDVQTIKEIQSTIENSSKNGINKLSR